MQSRFYTYPASFIVKTAVFFLFSLWASASVAQTQDSIIVTSVVYPTCQCDGGIDLTVTHGNQQPPSTNFAYFWSNGATTQDVFGLCPGSYCVTIVGGNAGTTPTIRCYTVPQLPYNPLKIVSNNTAPCNSDSSGIGHLCEKVCPGTTVTYSVFTQSSGGAADPIGWDVSGASSWTVNSSNSPFFSSITVTWSNPGTGSVSVFSDAAQGCAGQDFLCVTVVPEPQADFQTSPSAAVAGAPLEVCLGQTVQFQNLSTGAADQYEWFFSDDFSISSVENPQHTYLSPGTHTVRLIAMSDCLCADTTYLSVEVINATAPTLECVGTVCPGATVTYTASDACVPFSWSVDANGTILGGGTPDSDTITVQWNAGPLGTITLGAQPCSGAACPFPSVIEVPVISSGTSIRGQQRVCPGARETYSIEPFGGTGFTWSLPTGGNIVAGQGTNRVTVEWFSVPNPVPAAEHILTVTYDNCYLGCNGSAQLPVRILSSFGLSGPVERCEGASGDFLARLTSNNSPILCNWTLVAPNGSTVWNSAAATASPNVPFVNGSGTYRLFAVPADPNTTCTSQADWVIAIRGLPAEPTGILGETNICPGGNYTYEATGLPAGANVRWIVQNGPGAPQTLNGNPLVVNWGAVGPYELSAAQVSKDGLSCISETAGLVANSIQTSSITGDLTVCVNSKGAYIIPNVQQTDIVWSVIPPTAGSVANGQGSNDVEIFWNQAGSQSVSVSVCGQNATFGVTVLDKPVPVPQHPAGLCPNSTVAVQTTAPFADYAWKNAFGVVIGTDPTIMLGPGNYAIEVVDADGCAGSNQFSIEAWDQPNISLTTADPTGFCNNSITVTLTALTNTNSNYSYQWFQNNNPIPGATGSTYFTNQYGSYTVQATNPNGCTASAGAIVLFNHCGGGGGGSGLPGGGGDFCAPGTVQIVPDPTPRCDSFHLVLNDISGLYVAGSGQWVTGISGGAVLGTATGDEASFVYGNAGKYLVLVQVMLSNGSTCVALDSVSVAAVARFESQIGCPGVNSFFQNTTEILPQTGIAGYGWDFGDPASGPNNQSTLENPVHEFALSGNYGVILTVTTANGCTSSATAVLPIPNTPTPVFDDPLVRCAGNALEFSATANIGILNIDWDFGDPASGPSNTASGTTVYHDFPPGTYDVTATATNVQGCTATFTRSVTVAPNALSGDITPNNPLPICEGSSITLSAPAGGVSYLWSDADSTSIQSLLVDQEGSYRVTITDANGCTYAPPAVTVRVNQAPDALIKGLLFNNLGQVVGVSYPTVTVCEGEDVALQGVSNGAATYTWSVGGMDPVIFFTDDRNTLLPVGTHVYSITVTAGGTGCTAVSEPFLVTVNPVPDNFFISSPSFCAGNTNVISYNGPTPPGWQFIWNNGVSGTTLTTEQAGTYFIRVINEFGCEARSNPHTIMPGPPVASIPAGCHTRCRPDTLCLPNIPNIVSWQWYLDGSPIPGATSSNFVAQQSGTYWAQLTDIYGCSAASDPLSLNLLDGYGNIIGNVWADVNNNGVIDAGDTLLSGVTVVVFQNGMLFGAASSGANGQFALTNVLSTQYSFNVDPFSLPPNWNIVIGNDQTTLSGCNANGSVDFLLRFACQTFGALQLGACPGGFATYGGSNIAVGNSQIFQLTSFQGCDSTLLVSVVALPTSSSALSLSACPGGVANYNGTDIPVGTSQSFTFTNVAGCDSVVTVSVAALPTSSSALSLSACPGGVANYNGTDIPVGTSQSFTFSNVAGCDSVVTVSVAALPTSSSALSLSACPGGVANYNGTDIPVGTSQSFTFTNVAGCDSVVTVSVAALPTSSNALSLSACPGGVANYNGTDIPVGTSQSFTFSNVAGCDSVVTVSVAALPTSVSAFSVGVCPGETYVYQGMPLFAGAVEQFVLSNAAGCDSVVTVTVFQKNVSSSVLDVRVCPGQEYTYAGVSIAAGESREFHFVNAEQCDSTVTIFVTAFPETVFNLSAGSSCSNSPTGTIEAIGSSGGPGPYQYSLNQVDFQSSAVFNNLQPGAYTVYLRDANACVFEGETTLTAIPPLQATLADGILPCDSVGVRMEALLQSGDPGMVQFEWWNGSREPSTVAVEAGRVWVELRNQCETLRREASIYWAELGKDVDIVYVPNVFMPSATDSDNARFRPLFAAGITLIDFRFEVYDRWGNKLFESTNTADAWDGVFRSKAFNPGVLVWQLHADVGICGRVLKLRRKGDVTIVR